jgi:hypothetical protein
VTSGRITGFDALTLPVHPAGKPGASYEEFGQQKTESSCQQDICQLSAREEGKKEEISILPADC